MRAAARDLLDAARWSGFQATRHRSAIHGSPDLSFPRQSVSRSANLPVDVTTQTDRHRRAAHPEPIRNPLLTPTIQTKPPDLDHIFGREFPTASDLYAFSP